MHGLLLPLAVVVVPAGGRAIPFDGNIQSLAWRFIFDEVEGRSVSVDAQGILEALRKVYDAGELADEITGKK